MSTDITTPKPPKLIKYDAAVRAIKAASSVDEVLKIRNAAQRMQAWGRLAKDKTVEIEGAKIRTRAEWGIGKMMEEQRRTVGMAKGTRSQLAGRNRSGGLRKNPPDALPTLAESGVDKNLAARSRRLVQEIPDEEELEERMEEWANPPPKLNKPKRSSTRGHWVYDMPPPNELFYMHVEQVIELGEREYADVIVDDKILAAAQRAAAAWAHCVKRLEERHGS